MRVSGSGCRREPESPSAKALKSLEPRNPETAHTNPESLTTRLQPQKPLRAPIPFTTYMKSPPSPCVHLARTVRSDACISPRIPKTPETFESRENFEAAEEPKDEKVAELLARSGGGARWNLATKGFITLYGKFCRIVLSGTYTYVYIYIYIYE